MHLGGTIAKISYYSAAAAAPMGMVPCAAFEMARLLRLYTLLQSIHATQWREINGKVQQQL